MQFPCFPIVENICIFRNFDFISLVFRVFSAFRVKKNPLRNLSNLWFENSV